MNKSSFKSMAAAVLAATVAMSTFAVSASAASETPAFADPVLQQLVKDAVGTENELTPQDLEQFYYLGDYEGAEHAPLKSLDGVEKLTQLQSLTLQNPSQVSDLSPIAALTSLENVEVRSGQVSDISSVKNLTNLRALSLPNNKIKDISPLSGLSVTQNTYLEVNLSGNQITDISAAGNLKKLTVLDVSNNAISDISPLGNLSVIQTAYPKVSTLKLQNNKISDISALEKLQSLDYVNLTGNPIDLDSAAVQQTIKKLSEHAFVLVDPINMVAYGDVLKPASEDEVYIEGVSQGVKKLSVTDLVYPPSGITPASDAFVIPAPEYGGAQLEIRLSADVLKGDTQKLSIYKYFSNPDEIAAADKGKVVAAAAGGAWVAIGGNVVKEDSYIRTTVSDGGVYAAMASSKTAADIKGHKYQHDVEVIMAQGIMSGYGADEFAPEKGITRAEFAKVLSLATKNPLSKQNSTFSDVPADHWAQHYIATVQDYGLIQGYDAQHFGPEDKITRQDVMTIMQRANWSYESNGGTPELDKLSDKADVDSSYATAGVEMALELGMVDTDGGKVRPRDNATRAEVAKMLVVLLQQLRQL